MPVWVGVMALVLGSLPIAPVATDNALTLPAQRHLVRLDPGGGPAIWLLALQQGNQESHGLAFFRSDDDAGTWRYYAPIQPDFSHPDRADLVPIGNDVALVYSFEDAHLAGSTAHDVYFQRWRYQAATRGFAADARVRVFDSTSATTGFYRAELAVDSLGRFWVQAFKLEADGSHTAAIAVSTDGGATFQQQSALAHLVGERAGGRILSLGTKLLFLYDVYTATAPALMRTREDAAPLDAWGAEQVAFQDGVYHGAALSAARDGHGGVHLVYKDKGEALWYRRFDGTAFGPRTQLLTGGDWVVQPAITRVGDDLVVFFTRNLALDTNYELRVSIFSNGVFSAPLLLDGTISFKGYPAAVEELPPVPRSVPCFYMSAPNSLGAGTEMVAIHRWAVSVPTSLKIMRPHAGLVVRSGTQFQLFWSSTGTVERVHLEFSPDGGRRWFRFARDVPNSGTYTVSVPRISTARGKVRVIDAENSAVVGVSSGTFTIRR